MTLDDGTSGLPTAANWEQWAQGGFMPPLGAGGGPTGPLASVPGAPPAIDPATPAGAAELSPATLNQTTPAPLPALDYAGDNPAGATAPQTSVSDVGNRVSGLVKKAQDYFNPTVAPAPVTPAPEAPPTPKAPVLAAAQAAMPPAGVDRNGTAPAPVAPPEAPAPLADTQGPAGTPPSGDFYGSATPPPPALAPVVEAAAKKYGVPLNVATWVGSHESGWNSAAVGIPTSSGRAQGAWQFMPGTAKQYNLADPTDFASSTDAAMHYLSDLAQKNGGDWEKAVQQYGAFSTGMGAQRDAAAQAGFHAYMGGKPDAVFATNSLAGETTAPAAATPDPYKPLPMPFDPASLTMPAGSRLLALASGLLSGHSLGDGLGRGFQAMNNATAQDLQGKRAANTQTAEINAANYRNQYMQAMLGVKSAPKPFGQPILGSDGKTMLQGMRDGATGAVTYEPLPGTTTAQQRATTNQEAMTNRFDPVVKANLTQNAESGKDAAKDIESLQNSTAADMQSLAETQQARALIAANPTMMGPTLQARATRSLAELGIAGDANTLNAIQKMTAENRNTYLSSLTGGHVGGIRSNQELKNLSQAVADIGTSPAAADWIVQLQQRQLQQKMAWRDELNRRQTEDPQSVIGSNYLRTKSEFAKSYFTENPIPDYTGGMAAPNASAAAPAPHGPVTQVLHYDAQGNQIK